MEVDIEEFIKEDGYVVRLVPKKEKTGPKIFDDCVYYREIKPIIYFFLSTSSPSSC